MAMPVYHIREARGAYINVLRDRLYENVSRIMGTAAPDSIHFYASLSAALGVVEDNVLKSARRAHTAASLAGGQLIYYSMKLDRWVPPVKARTFDIHERILQALSKSDWRSVDEIARTIQAHPSSVSSHLYFLLSRGRVVWKPRLSSRGPLKMMFKLVGDSQASREKPYPPEVLGKEIDEALKSSVGSRYYYAGPAALFLYNLLDRFANLNLAEVHVPRKLSEPAVDALNNSLSESYIIVPDRMPWEDVMRAMQVGSVLRVVPRYKRGEKARIRGRNVQKIEALLRTMKSYASPSELKSAATLAADQGLIDGESLAAL